VRAITIGLAATTAGWSAEFRSYVRDHGQDADVEVIMGPEALRRAYSRLDVLVVDDIMRVFGARDLAALKDSGAHVVGVSEPSSGMGRQYLLALGAEQVVAATIGPQELLALLRQVAPPRSASAHAKAPVPPWSPQSVGKPGPARGLTSRASVSAWTKVSGGAGLTEMVVAAADCLAAGARVLVVEAEEVAPVLVSRLLRSPEGGLPWALSRAGQGLRAFPEGLSGPREDGTTPLGRFDVACAAPGAPHAISPGQLMGVLEQAAASYDYVLVETGWLLGAPVARERFSAIASVLRAAGSVIVVGSADPEGAARLVQWKAAALANAVTPPCWAVFGRARKSRYERQHLRSLIEANTGRHPFSGISFLPEDVTVARARWNCELPWKGPWLVSVRQLVTLALTRPTAGASPGRRGGVGRLAARGAARPLSGVVAR